MKPTYEELERERNELAAQVERLRSVVEEYHSENIACEEAINELVFMLNQPESAALAAIKAQWQAEAFDSPVIETTMKAGCIGEFSFTVRGAGVCPVCHEDGFDRDCETCDGNGVVDLSVEVPWDIQKAIFKSMCKYKAASIRQRAQEAAND